MRRGSIMKARPGYLFVVFLIVCVIVFYLSWQMLMSPRYERKFPETRHGIKLARFEDHQAFRVDDAAKKRTAYDSHLESQVAIPKQLKNDFIDKIEKGEASDTETDRELVEFKKQLDQKLHSPLEKRKEVNEENQIRELNTLKEEEEKSFYLNPIDSLKPTVKSMDKLVHLDFKGAVPKLNYLKELVPLVKSLGATGLLVEYEDMFPFSGTIKSLKAADAFTLPELQEFLQVAEENDLMVMPLIQTFGHMEFLLKSAFPWLRESSYTPQVVDMTNNMSYTVISTMVQQVLDAHPDSDYIHIGCDEVYELGRGNSATVMNQKGLSRGQMFLKHVKQVASIVTSYPKRKVMPVMWDDMLRKIPLQDILRSSISSFVEVMVWHYTPDVAGQVREDVFGKYEQIFESLWIASSFKGATGSRQFYTEPQYHIKNHFSWLAVMEKHFKNIQIKGVALTGWQRFDHFATLCELIPVAIPSLAVCLATLTNAGFTEDIHKQTSKLLRCDGMIEMTFPALGAGITQDCRFPGSDVYYVMQEFYNATATQVKIQHRLDGWLSDYQVSHGFTNPGQMKVLAMDLNLQNNKLTTLERPLRLHLSSIYSSNDVEEWLEEHVLERKRHNQKILEKVNTLLTFKTWPQRPLKPEVFVEEDRSEQMNLEENPPETPVVDSRINDPEKPFSDVNAEDSNDGAFKKEPVILKKELDSPKVYLKPIVSHSQNLNNRNLNSDRVSQTAKSHPEKKQGVFKERDFKSVTHDTKISMLSNRPDNKKAFQLDTETQNKNVVESEWPRRTGIETGGFVQSENNVKNLDGTITDIKEKTWDLGKKLGSEYSQKETENLNLAFGVRNRADKDVLKASRNLKRKHQHPKNKDMVHEDVKPVAINPPRAESTDIETIRKHIPYNTFNMKFPPVANVKSRRQEMRDAYSKIGSLPGRLSRNGDRNGATNIGSSDITKDVVHTRELSLDKQ